MLEYKTISNLSAATIEYGIALYRCGKLVKRVPNLSENKRDIQRLTAVLNELKVEHCHFEDIIEDYLTDFTV